MLALTLTEGDSVHIGEGVTVHMVWVQGGRARVAFTAPKDIPIVRQDKKDSNEPA